MFLVFCFPGCSYTVVPASLYLGFSASVIWIRQVSLLALDSLLNFSNFPFHAMSILLLQPCYRVPISLPLHEIMLKIQTCMKEQLLAALMESSGDCSPAIR